MEGSIHTINSQSELVAVDTTFGFSIFEQTSPDFEIGDFVNWTSDYASSAISTRNPQKDIIVFEGSLICP